MTKRRGFFIVLEGLDGAGTTTQAARLAKYLTRNGLPCHLTNEPTAGPVGTLIREGLSGALVDHATGKRVQFTETAQSLLFAADRIEHSIEIEQLKAAGTHIVCDRYVHSSIAYQSLDPATPAERVVEVNRGVAVPDLTLFVDVPVDECLRRLGGRNDAPSIYEKKDLLERIDANYRSTMALYEKHYGRVVAIDGTKSIEAVAAEIQERVASELG